MQLNICHVSFSYPEASGVILDDINTTLPDGWTGFIGDNGCGKTTLALIASGLLRPDRGTISPQFYSSYCYQDSSIEPANISDFAMDWSQDATHLKSTLAIEDEWLWRFDSLSGGQQKRIQIACCLWERPDLLVMDEPTNNLDVATRKMVERVLSEFKGIGILISHDRSLLDDLVERCLVFENGTAVMRPGNYTSAVAQAKAQAKTALHTREKLRNEVTRLHKEAVRRNEEAQRSKARLSGRNLNKGDSDTREKLGRAKVSSKDGIAGKASSVMTSRLDVAQSELKRVRVPKRYDYQFEMKGVRAASKTICHLEKTMLQNDAFSLFVPELWVSPTDHIGIVGENGTGKSTLIRHIVSNIPNSIRAGYIPQNVSETQRKEVLRRLRAYNQKDRGLILSHVARLNSNPASITGGKDISPGEMRKLILCDLLFKEPNLLVLDEPTNHLDIASIDALQELLSSFLGAIILVSHDTKLIKESCNVIWSVKKAASSRYVLQLG